MDNKLVVIPALTDEQRVLIRQIAAKHGAQRVRVFGSSVRGEGNCDK